MILRAIGKTLIGLGLLILAFIGYQLLGTNVVTGQSQSHLRIDLERAWAEPPPVEPSSVQEIGSGIAQIQIPKIGVDRVVVEGVGVDDLKKGPGHYPGTAIPGQVGNSVISGHRTTYGAPFYRLDELVPGDVIKIIDRTRTEYRYRVSELRIVLPTDRKSTAPTSDSRLTLTTCHPRFSARQRLIVVAILEDTQKEGTG